MQKFMYSYPTRVYFGEGAAADALKQELPRVGRRVMLAFGHDEQAAGIRPELASRLENLQRYDTIFLGYPIWLAYHKLIQCTQLHEWVHFKFTYKIHSFAPAIGRGFFYWQKKSTSFPVWE